MTCSCVLTAQALPTSATFWGGCVTGVPTPVPHATRLQRHPADPPSHGKGPGVLAESRSIVWSGNQNNFLVNFAKRSKFSIERALCCPHNQNSVVRFQESQDFWKLFFEAFRFDLGEGGRGEK